MAGWMERQRRKHGQQGFTLIELLVVIIILGILAAVVVFAVGGVGDKGKSSAYAIDVRTLRTAEEAYLAQNGVYGTEAELVTAGLLSEQSSMNDIALAADKKSYSIGSRGGTIVVGATFGLGGKNPASSTSGAVHANYEAMYNGLVLLDEKGNPSPELVTEVPTVENGGITANGASYTLKLRDNVFWHDSGVTTTASSPGGNTNPSGAIRKFTADDVKFTFEKVLLQHHARARNMSVPLGYVGSPTCEAANIVVVDPLTVKFTFSAPYAPFLKQLNVTEAAMVPKHPYASAGACPTAAVLDANAIGTGAFMFSGLNTPQNGDAKLVRNPNYWRPGLPFLDAIVIRPLTVDATRYNALLNREVDWLWDVPNPNVAALQGISGFATASTQSLGGGPNSIDQLIFNMTQSGTGTVSPPNNQPGEPARYGQIGGSNPSLTAPPHAILGDLNVRKALFHAISRDLFLNPGRNNIGKIATAPISSELPQHATDIVLPSFSPATANTLLDAAGWNGPRTTVSGVANIRTTQGHPILADGTPFNIRFLYGNAVYNTRAAQMKIDLEAVGIFLSNELDASSTTARVFTHRNFDISIINYAQGYDPHVGVRRQYHSDQVSTSGTPNNGAGYKNGTVDAAFDAAATNIDPVFRFNKYHEAQVQIASDLPYMWMIETPNVRGYNTRCSGLRAWTGQFAETASCRT